MAFHLCAFRNFYNELSVYGDMLGILNAAGLSTRYVMIWNCTQVLPENVGLPDGCETGAKGF